MYHGIVVTLIGPCMVPKNVFREIVQRKAEGDFGDQVKLCLEIDIDGLALDTSAGEIQPVKTMELFISQYLSIPPSGGRNILI